MTFARLPLTTRLTVLFTLVAAAVLLGFGAIVVWSTERHFVHIDRIYLDDKAHLVEKLVFDAPTPTQLARTLDDMLDSHHGLFVQLWIDGRLIYGPADLSPGPPPALLTPGQIAEWTHDGRKLRGYVEDLPAASGPEWPPGQGGFRGQVLVALDTAHHAQFLASLRRTLAIYFLAAIAVSGVLGGWAARRGLAPLKAMRETTTSITAHNLQGRMPAASVPEEFAELAQSLNVMFDRLQRDVQRLMDFSSDLAHELRTPLSNLLTQTQVALSQKRDAEAYRDILASNAEELERLAKTVSDMLFLAKTENGIELPQRERIRLDEEVRALFDFYEAVAHDQHIRLELEGQAELDGDRLMMRRAISNLLSNALRHADGGTVVRVNLSSANGVVRLDVLNEGRTIDAADIPRIFDRFYRADRSRSHPASEGAGLGLAITQAIVHLHGGTIRVESEARRTRFSIALPGSAHHPA